MTGNPAQAIERLKMRKSYFIFITLLLVLVLGMVPVAGQGSGGPGTPGGSNGPVNGNDQGGNDQGNQPGDDNGEGDGGYGWGDHAINRNLVLPQFAVGSNVTTTLVLANLGNPLRLSWLSPGECTTSGRVSFFSDTGEPLEVSIGGSSDSLTNEYSFSLGASEVQFLEISRNEDTLAKGWILIEVDDQSTSSGTATSDWGYMDGKKLERGDHLMASAYYTITGDSGNVTSQVAVRPTRFEAEEFFNSLLPVQVSSGVNTGVAVVNTGADPAKVTLRLRDATAAQIQEKVVELDAGAQLAKFVTEIFDISGDMQGVLEVQTESEGIVAIGLLQTGQVLTSLPVHHYGRWSRD